MTSVKKSNSVIFVKFHNHSHHRQNTGSWHLRGDSMELYGLQKLFVSVSLKICGIKRIRATVSNCKKGFMVQHHKRMLWSTDDCRHAFLDCPASNPQATGNQWLRRKRQSQQQRHWGTSKWEATKEELKREDGAWTEARLVTWNWRKQGSWKSRWVTGLSLH